MNKPKGIVWVFFVVIGTIAIGLFFHSNISRKITIDDFSRTIKSLKDRHLVTGNLDLLGGTDYSSENSVVFGFLNYNGTIPSGWSDLYAVEENNPVQAGEYHRTLKLAEKFGGKSNEPPILVLSSF